MGFLVIAGEERLGEKGRRESKGKSKFECHVTNIIGFPIEITPRNQFNSIFPPPRTPCSSLKHQGNQVIVASFLLSTMEMSSMAAIGVGRNPHPPLRKDSVEEEGDPASNGGGAGGGGGGGGGGGDESGKDDLLAMGFDKEKVEFALRYFDGNLQKATEYLLHSDGIPSITPPLPLHYPSIVLHWSSIGPPLLSLWTSLMDFNLTNC